MPNLPSERVEFKSLHQEGNPFIIPNPWDVGSARVLEGLGFSALATTSSGFALTKGRRDYGVTRQKALAHGDEIARAVDIPVTADLENGFGNTPEDAAKTIEAAYQTSLCGGSIEDSSGDESSPVLDKSLAIERIAASVEAAQDGFVLTARAEAFLYDAPDLDDVIARLQGFEAAGADVLYAPGLPDIDTVKIVCEAVSKPVNVLLLGDLINHAIDDFAEAGVARISIGGGLAWAAYGAFVETAQSLKTGEFKRLTDYADGAKTAQAFLKG